MTQAKSTIAVFAALIALGATLDAQAGGKGGGMGHMHSQGSGQMGGQGMSQYGGQFMNQQQRGQANGNGAMARERTQMREQTRTRTQMQSGTPDMQQDMAQRRAMNQAQYQIR